VAWYALSSAGGQKTQGPACDDLEGHWAEVKDGQFEYMLLRNYAGRAGDRPYRTVNGFLTPDQPRFARMHGFNPKCVGVR